jgi:hypothetical protein
MEKISRDEMADSNIGVWDGFFGDGPLSCRSNDLNALGESHVQDIIRQLCNHGIGEFFFHDIR